ERARTRTRPDHGRRLLPPLRRRGDLTADAYRQRAWIAHGSRRFRTWLRCRVRSGATAREVRSFPRSEARRRLAALAVHVASAKVLLGRQQIVGRTPKLQVVHAVRAAQRVRFAVVQLQAARLRTAPSSIVGVST